jgi:hypothetical protein
MMTERVPPNGSKPTTSNFDVHGRYYKYRNWGAGGEGEAVRRLDPSSSQIVGILRCIFSLLAFIAIPRD